jgi:hypothetical protein
VDDAFTPEMLERRKDLPRDHSSKRRLFDNYSEYKIDEYNKEMAGWFAAEEEALKDLLVEELLKPGYSRFDSCISIRDNSYFASDRELYYIWDRQSRGHFESKWTPGFHQGKYVRDP